MTRFLKGDYMKFNRSTPLLILAGAITLYGAMLFMPTKATAAGVCCTYGQDCAGTQGCYYPTAGEADCSPDNPNYCGGGSIQ